ncbi:hypothetical protein [Saccharopolyspora gloriosae]|uniref:hypothetical protein n=1 Tax=Saccharopolyspora gloriosae TaxID=455344 RepID=UPI001FB59010|nr:hypothetical protein [Saccharopolyspora gloriosae]
MGLSTASVDWRIDYQVATPGLVEHAVDAWVERALSSGKRWRDHAPVTVSFDL